ncbi:tetratricopeptide repeat protein [Tabrizicola sp. BL-A-41-H6]|uniref:tetratricopeptide repeat protein n=1 Tax=Tabrizicola sp. BL-A-41-H6 TaxID=3421107 RepID=UPI003D6794B2
MTKPRSAIGLSAAVLLLFPAVLGAQTLPLDFAPPEMEVTPVCAARPSDAQIIAEWSAWDGRSLPDRPVELINRDIRRLAELDPARWDPTIQRVIDLMPGVSPSFSADHVILARIEQMIALGRLQDLKASGLVQQLLDRGEANSPRMLNALAGFLTEGIGIDRDAARGAELLMSAGYGGNADALLTLSKLAVAGQAPEGWDISPDLAVTMAFGSLVGQMDPLICDRIARIAREFSSGEVVAVDHDLAVRWYRFAADLGDPIAAWRVAEYHLQSELVTKDNDVLLTYLTKAANGNLPYAQVALGRVYEAGALVPMDLERAQSLYEAAAAEGDRAALIRLSGFLEARVADRPDLKPAFLDTLDRLQALDVAPPWVFGKQALHVLEEKGRWAGQAEARALLERGAELDDPAAIIMLAQMNLGAAESETEFYAAVDQMIHAVTNLGEVGPTTDLQAAFMCKAPNAPHLEESAYWAATEAAIGSTSLALTDMALAELSDNPDPLEMAALQTQALYGRATPLAGLLAVLERSDAPESERTFWAAYAERFPNVDTARASLALDRAQTTAERTAALEVFRKAAAAGEDRAGLKLAKALLEGAPDAAAQAEALALLVPLAEAGDGEALGLLPLADPVKYPDARAVYAAFARAIDARGDFPALMLAMRFLPDEAAQKAYRARAISAMKCDFPETVAFASAMAATGDIDEARRWLRIATELAADDPWQTVELADAYRTTLPNAESEKIALAFYRKAHALGSRTAVQRLLRIYSDKTRPDYDQAKIVSLYVDLVARSDTRQIAGVLDEISRKEPKLRAAVEARLDLDRLYAEAAKAGNPAAMREHASRLRAAAQTRDEIETSTAWLLRASEAGDVPAMVMLAQSYSLGVGVPISVENARIWLRRAAEAGDPTAIDMVKMFTAEGETN